MSSATPGGGGDVAARAPTQADVARIAQVHRTTVGLALKDHPGLPESTRLRIQKIAQKIGYAPDPMLSALIARRNQGSVRTFQGTLAWLVNNVAPWDWRGAFLEYHEGACQRAAKYGYKVEIFDLQTPGMTVGRMAAIFNSRNIRGILLAPLPRPDTALELPWERFSTVAFGYTLVKPQLHMVGAAQFRGLSLVMRKLAELGYQRIGFAFSPEHNLRVDQNYLAAYVVDEYTRSGAIRIPPLSDMMQFSRWYEQHRPEVVILSDGHGLEQIRSLGLRVPRDVGVVFPFFPTRQTSLSGIYENSLRIGEAGVDLLVAMVQRGERGIPVAPQRILIDGIWVPGTTLRSRPVRAAPRQDDKSQISGVIRASRASPRR